MINGPNTIAIRLQVHGIVQGVGFRPFVYREATRRGLTGWVRNDPSGVEIIAAGETAAIDAFMAALRENAPPAARIDRIETSPAPRADDGGTFSIIESEHAGTPQSSLLPDLATCPDCLRELRDPCNRRFRYPFINCTHCGPRYSIMRRLPYDRIHTTMRTFAMCPECRREYEDPSDRRFHAQPNACPACGPQLAFWNIQGRCLAGQNDALLEAGQCLINGGIVAVKGVGGFHLMCDATNDQAVRNLRARKHREEKPFAVMMPDVATAKRYADISEQESAALTSRAAPIVLLKKSTRENRDRRPCRFALNGLPLLSDAVSPHNPRLGIMLPYAPLHHLLLDEVARPLVATSGNLSDEPICIDEYEALARLRGIADFFLVHNRPIAHPVDDSVMRIALGQPLRLRVARGWAPVSLPRPADTGTLPILAVGPHMKSTLALATAEQFVVSPHVGDLETIPAWESFERNLETLEGIYDITPVNIACDRHPDYASTRYAMRRNESAVKVQHHHAHILSVMAEHNLAGPALGFAFDGTGYGDDGTIWGGEVLRVDRGGYRRVAHLRTFSLPGGDSAAREPRRSALGVLFEIRAEARITDMTGYEANQVCLLTQAMRKNINTVRTSSMGRLFDAAASILGLCQQSGYEGQAAMLLQAEAEKVEPDGTSYPVSLRDGEPLVLDWEPIITGILADRDAGIHLARIAARFHQSIVDTIVAVAERYPGLPVALGGGCFQNVRLLEESVKALQKRDRIVYWSRILPPNDGGISTGQLLAAAWSVSR